MDAASLALKPPTAALKAVLDALPGGVAQVVSPPRSSVPIAITYKLCGKMFAILAVRANEHVVLKCDPHLVEILKQQYGGVAHRTHLDRRFWIAVSLDADVPADEVARLAEGSYQLIRAGLTRKQQAELAALAG